MPWLPAPEKRYLLLLWFHCDASFDPNREEQKQENIELSGKHIPETFVVGGFVAQDHILEQIQNKWAECNKFYNVKRYHAVDVNGRHGEFEGWSKPKRDEYAIRMLEILSEQGNRINTISMGLKAKDYERIITENGREKWGNPYIVCFKQCVAFIAQLMGNLPTDYKFSVIVERDEFTKQAIDIFDEMKDDMHWGGYNDRLVTCTRGNPLDIIPLQPADMIAYETFRFLHSPGEVKKLRPSMKSLIENIVMEGKWWNADRLKVMEPILENANVGPNRFIALWEDQDLERKRFQIG